MIDEKPSNQIPLEELVSRPYPTIVVQFVPPILVGGAPQIILRTEHLQSPGQGLSLGHFVEHYFMGEVERLQAMQAQAAAAANGQPGMLKVSG